jgi:hypothetical protein
MKTREIKASQIIEQFLHQELSDYSQLYEHIKIVSTNVLSFGQISVHAKVRNKSLYFIVKFKEHFDDTVVIDEDNFYDNIDITIEFNEDSYETTEGFNSSIKYLWMTLLDWDDLFND